MWTGGLPHLPRVPYLHVNRPLNFQARPQLSSTTEKFRHDFNIPARLYIGCVCVFDNSKYTQ